MMEQILLLIVLTSLFVTIVQALEMELISGLSRCSTYDRSGGRGFG